MDIFFIVTIILAICFYFLPTTIVSIRHLEHGTGIFRVNFLFGWTVLGWIAALIWEGRGESNYSIAGVGRAKGKRSRAAISSHCD
jgi:ABC-type sugar transport system permease subunit